MRVKGAHSDHKKNILYSFLVIGLLFSGMAWNVYSFLGIKGICEEIGASDFWEIMGRSREWYAGPYEKRFFTGFFQQHLENATSDHFPTPFIFTYKWVSRWFDKEFLDVLPSDWTPLLPIGGDVLLAKNEKALIRTPETLSQQKRELLRVSAERYNRFIRENPSVRLVLVPVLSKADWAVMYYRELGIDTAPFTGDKYVREFFSLLDDRIQYFFPGNELSPREALECYYKTDHHLCMKGSYTAYRQLIDKLYLKDMEETPVLVPKKWFKLPGLIFRGSDARAAGKLETIYDEIEDADFDLPDFQIYVNGVPSGQNSGYVCKENYKSRIGDSTLSGAFVDHYNYFGKNYGLLEYMNPDVSRRNIVVIGDSYDNCITPLISRHYHHAFFIDPRNFEKETGREFNLTEFIRDHKIDDLVYFADQRFVLGFSEWKEE